MDGPRDLEDLIKQNNIVSALYLKSWKEIGNFCDNIAYLNLISYLEHFILFFLIY